MRFVNNLAIPVPVVFVQNVPVSVTVPVGYATANAIVRTGATFILDTDTPVLKTLFPLPMLLLKCSCC